jgi:DNA-binding transcriptional MerR regulator
MSRLAASYKALLARNAARQRIKLGRCQMQQYQDLLIDALLDQGFSLAEAERLITLQERLEQARIKVQQQREIDRWLIANSKTEPSLKN